MGEIQQSLILHGNISAFVLFANSPPPFELFFSARSYVQHWKAFETIRMTILLVVPRPVRSNPRVMWLLLRYNDHDTVAIVQISWVRPRKLVQQAIKKCNGQINATIMHFEDTGRQRLCTRKCLSRWAVPVLSGPLTAPFQRFEYRDCVPGDVSFSPETIRLDQPLLPFFNDLRSDITGNHGSRKNENRN